MAGVCFCLMTTIMYSTQAHMYKVPTVLSPMLLTVHGRCVVCPMTAVMFSDSPASNSGFTLLKLAVLRKCWNTPEINNVAMCVLKESFYLFH